MLHAVLNKAWKQHPTKTAAVRPLTSHFINIQDLLDIAGGSKGERISHAILSTAAQRHTTVRPPEKNYIHLCDTGCHLEDFVGNDG